MPKEMLEIDTTINEIEKEFKKLGVKSWLVFALQEPESLLFTRSENTEFIRAILRVFIREPAIRESIHGVIHGVYELDKLSKPRAEA